MAVVIGELRRLAVIQVDQRLGLDGLLDHRPHREVAQRLDVDLAIGEKRERAVLVPGLPRVGGRRGIAHIGVDDGRDLAADLVGIAMSAADPSAAAIIADALVPVGWCRQPDLDADTFRVGARGLVLFRGDAGAHQQLHQAEVGSRNDRRLGHIARGEFLAFLHQPNRHHRRVGIGAESRLDAIVARQRLRKGRRHVTAAGQQQHRQQTIGRNLRHGFQGLPPRS